jgi:diguanylate cyclase (GGDEF)-like protein
VEEGPATILVVDDSDQDLRIHAATLRGQGYEVITACSGEEALLLVEATIPDLFLIDSRMKGMDGYALCERIKDDNQLINVPVIFVTDDPAAEDIDRAYAAGGIDYIAKPCHLSEFLARVRTHIYLYHLLLENERWREVAIDSNPLTHLPGNNTVVTTLQKAIEEKQDLCVIYVDVDHFKAYNDRYGFSAGDDLLLFTAEILVTAIRKVCAEDEGFLGHIGGDDFMLLVPQEQAVEVGTEIIRRFDSGAPNFYSDEEASHGYIEAEDRQGNRSVFPLTSISLGGVMLLNRDFEKYIEVADVCADVKHRAKKLPGSNFFMDRREGPLDLQLDTRREAGGNMAAHGTSVRGVDSPETRDPRGAVDVEPVATGSPVAKN